MRFSRALAAIAASVLFAGAIGIPALAQSEAPTGAPPAASAAGPQPVDGGTLTIAVPQDIITLDTVNSGATTSSAVRNMIYDKLVVFKPNQDTLELAPQLATEWSVDGTAWTFKLRPDVTFTDGTPFDAAAVKAHFDRLIGSEEPVGAKDFAPYLASTDVVDDHTVQFNTKAPDPLFPERLAGTSGSIESPAAFAQYGADISTHPVGTGPFKFVEWVQDDHVTLERNDDYWGGRPHLDQVIVKSMPEAGARVIALQSNDVNLATGIQPEQIGQLQGDGTFSLESWPTTRQLFIGLHNLKAPFDNPTVRQALNYAIDWNTIAQTIYQGTAQYIGGPVPATAIGAANVAPFTFDPDKARSMLADANQTSISVDFTGTNGAYLKDYELEQAVQQQLADVGVTANLDVKEFSDYIDLVRMPTETSPLVMWLDSWSDNDAGSILRQRYDCDMFRPAGVNLDGYCNQAVDPLIDTGIQSLDESARLDALSQAQTIVAGDAPSIWGLVVSDTWAASSSVHDALHAPSEEVWADAGTWIGQ